MSSHLTIRAHAKINLSLRVGPRGPDGFHELRTVYQALDWHDSLEFEARPGPLSLACDVAGVPLDSSNLVWRAAAALWMRVGGTGEPRDVEIHLTKRIPLQAGLGGGSADAAATLLALNRLWRAALSPAELAELAARLGSDVPFFLVGGTALGLGRGEIVEPLADAPSRSVVLVCPPAGVSTAEAYGWYDADRLEVERRSYAVEPTGATWPAAVVNDLQAPVVRRRPDVGLAIAALDEAGALAAGMTGSGSGVFGLFGSRQAALAAARSLGAALGRIIITKSMSRAAYEQRAHARAVRPGAHRTL